MVTQTELIYCISAINTQQLKDQMYQYNCVISGDMFRPLNGHPQANKNSVVLLR